jgi:hypothetical protein
VQQILLAPLNFHYLYKTFNTLNQKPFSMKTKFTYFSLVTAAFLLLGHVAALADPPQVKGKEENPNFRYIDDFEPLNEVSLWWAPEGSGSTTGHILEIDGELVTYREFETEIVNPATGKHRLHEAGLYVG